MTILDEVNAIGNNTDPHYIQDAWRILERIEQWQKDPQNDCLRARGDKQWDEMQKAHERITEILLPF